VDSRTGRQKWRFKTDNRVKSSPAIAGGVVYIGSFDSHLYAVDVETGLEKWKFETGFKVFSSPVAADGVIYFGSDDGRLYALE
jgi:outer membrane protein assembly factor BamB